MISDQVLADWYKQQTDKAHARAVEMGWFQDESGSYFSKAAPRRKWKGETSIPTKPPVDKVFKR